MANDLIQTLSTDLDYCLTNVAGALPKAFNRERFLQNTIAVIGSNDDLLKYNKKNLLACMLKGSYLGLDFANKECYIVPYNGKLEFQTSYKGECKFVKKYSIRPLKDLKAEVVRVNDEFEYGIKDNKPYLDFKPLPFNDGDVVGAFAIAYFEDGGILYEVMNMTEIKKVRNVSRAASSNKSPWQTFPEEMYKKTVLRRLTKQIETDFDSIEQREAWDAGSGVDFTNKPEPTEVHNPFKQKEEELAEENVVDSVAVEIDEMEQLEMPFTEPKKGD